MPRLILRCQQAGGDRADTANKIRANRARTRLGKVRRTFRAARINARPSFALSVARQMPDARRENAETRVQNTGEDRPRRENPPAPPANSNDKKRLRVSHVCRVPWLHGGGHTG